MNSLATALVALTLVAPGDTLIRGQIGTMLPGGDDDGKKPPVLQIPFNVPGDYASGTTTLATPPQALTVTRTSAATYENPPGTLVTAAAGRIRVAASGALIEAAATNYALQSATHPKTTEASASVTTGAAVAWHAGTGTMTLAAGTATVTGLSCTTVAAGTPCTFTVTVAGTMAITTTAGTTRVQIEKGSTPTSYIATTTTSAARTADVVSTGSYAAGSLCLGVTATPSGWLWSAAPGTLGRMLYIGRRYSGTYECTGLLVATNLAQIYVSTYRDGELMWDAFGANHSVADLTNSLPVTWRGGTSPLTVYENGALANTGVNVPSFRAGALNMGLDSGSNTFGGYLKDVKVWNVPCAKAR